MTYRTSSKYLIPTGIGRGTRYRINTKFHEKGSTSNVASNVASNRAEKKRTRLSTNDLYAAILNTCRDFESLESIANKVGKKQQYLKNSIIPTMVANDLLEREYPHIPKHPKQRYRAKKGK